jgi:hypothetical protein
LTLASGRVDGPPPAVIDPAVGTMVGAYLLDAADRRRPVRAVGEALAMEITRDPAGAVRFLADRLNSARRVAVLVIADGSACHGDAAPGRQDDRAEPFDMAVARALASGDPAALRVATADRALAGELLASVDPLAVLALLTAARPPDGAELLYSAAPLGVGYFVACWRWAGQS